MEDDSLLNNGVKKILKMEDSNIDNNNVEIKNITGLGGTGYSSYGYNVKNNTTKAILIYIF